MSKKKKGLTILKKITIAILLITLFNIKLMAKTENYLRHTNLIENRLELKFKYPIKKVHHFTIKTKRVVKHIYDIKNSSLPKTQNISQFRYKGVKAFRIAQYNQKIIRVVIETETSMSDMKGDFKISGRKVIMSLGKQSKKRQTIKAKNKNKAKKSIKPKKTIHKKTIHKKYSHRRNRTIILDAGHGGRDIGASSKYVREKDLTLSMTLKLKRILQRMGYTVLLTRSRDKFMNLKQRTDYAYYSNASLFISIHANAEPKKRTRGVKYEGMEVFYLGLANSTRVGKYRVHYRGKAVYSRGDYQKMLSSWKFRESKKLAYCVHRNIVSHVRKRYVLNDKGVKRQDFWVLLATKIPSILVETGYLTHKNEGIKLRNVAYQKRLMEGIAKGVNQYYGR